VGVKLNSLILEDFLRAISFYRLFFPNSFYLFWSVAKVISHSLYPKLTLYTQLPPITFFTLTSQCSALLRPVQAFEV